jgi:hypothetical protein
MRRPSPALGRTATGEEEEEEERKKKKERKQKSTLIYHTCRQSFT